MEDAPEFCSRYATRIPVAALLILLVVGSFGCESQSKWGRVPVGGVANLDGKPFEGSICFRPERGVSGPTVNAPVRAGKFQFSKSTGPVVGKHKAILMPKTEGQRIDVIIEAIVDIVEDSADLSLEFETPAADPPPRKPQPVVEEAIPEK